MRTCNRCGNVKPLVDFSLHPNGRDGRHPTCKECKAVEARDYYQRNRERLKNHPRKAAWNRSKDLRKKFNLTVDQYDELLASQGGGCAICAREPGEQNLPVDHDHVTGTVRGILCRNCNVALGLMADDAALLRAAAQYLESQPAG